MNLFQKLKNRALRWTARGPSGPHLTRYFMYERLAAVAKGLDRKGGRLLSVSHSTGFATMLGFEPSETVEANYPEHNLLDLAFEDNSFDVVVSDQVLEHVEGSPYQAIGECTRVLKPGGLAIHTTCLINPIHKVPGDFWRFTPDGLALLHADYAETIDCDGWGNEAAWEMVRTGLRFHPVPHAHWHPLHKVATSNDPLWPIVTWIVARK